MCSLPNITSVIKSRKMGRLEFEPRTSQIQIRNFNFSARLLDNALEMHLISQGALNTLPAGPCSKPMYFVLLRTYI
jgi:hypothetical protein